jgi:hypothetical protein
MDLVSLRENRLFDVEDASGPPHQLEDVLGPRIDEVPPKMGKCDDVSQHECSPD